VFALESRVTVEYEVGEYKYDYGESVKERAKGKEADR